MICFIKFKDTTCLWDQQNMHHHPVCRCYIWEYEQVSEIENTDISVLVFSLKDFDVKKVVCGFAV